MTNSVTHSVLRDDINIILRAALSAVDPANAVAAHARRVGPALHFSDGFSRDLNDVDRIVLLGLGKAAVPMAQAILPMIADKPVQAIIATKYGHSSGAESLRAAKHLTLIESAHPVPDENSIRAGNAVWDALGGLSEKSLVIACISGGASALVAAPLDGIRLGTLRAINTALLASGADIREMNTVRAAIDRLKGGGLVRRAVPAQVVGLVLSDVIGDPLDVIASGLTNDPSAKNILVGNNTQACQAAARAAQQLGYAPRIVTTALTGEARTRGREIAMSARSGQPNLLGHAPGAREALIFGGETTVTLRGAGKGGRNQELALAAAIELDGATGEVCVASFGTDGTDGPTDAAGAIALPDTLARARAIGQNASAALDANDSYPFFAALGDLILTGPTGTNVADVVVALRG